MLVHIIENGKAVDDELAGTELIGTEKHSGGVASRRRIPGGERGGDYLRRGVLSVEKIVRPHWTVVIHVEDAFSLESIEHSMRLGHALFVVKHVLKTEDAPLLGQRQTRGAVFLTLEGLGSKKHNRAAPRHARRQFFPLAGVGVSRNVSHQDQLPSRGICSCERRSRH